MHIVREILHELLEVGSSFSDQSAMRTQSKNFLHEDERPAWVQVGLPPSENPQVSVAATYRGTATGNYEVGSTMLMPLGATKPNDILVKPYQQGLLLQNPFAFIPSFSLSISPQLSSQFSFLHFQHLQLVFPCRCSSPPTNRRAVAIPRSFWGPGDWEGSAVLSTPSFSKVANVS